MIVIYNNNLVNLSKKSHTKLQALTESQKNSLKELEKANENSKKCKFSL